MLVMVANGQPVLADTGPAPLETTISAIEATADVVPETTSVVEEPYKPTVQEVLTVVCNIRGYGPDCAQTLLGMLWTESSNVYNVIGDSGRARGYFQIHYKLHNISTDCAEDLVCSADWTISYLERNGYPTYNTYAVQCHNGCGFRNGYTNKVARHGAYFWDQPLEITQAAPIDLSQLTKKPADVEIAMK